MVDGLLAGQHQVEAFVLGVCRHLHGHVVPVLGLGIHAHGIIRANGQGLADGGFRGRAAHGDGGNGAALGFLQLQASHQRIPFIIGVHDELDAVGIVGGIVRSEGNARRGVRHVGDEHKDLHG